MSESDWIYILFSLITSFCFIFNEFASAGVSINGIFGKFFGDEYTQFVQHHILRTSLTLIVHSSLPLFFILLRILSVGPDEGLFYQIFVTIALLLPTITFSIVFYWWRNDWKDHPIVKCLSVYMQNDEWISLVIDINTEYRSQDRMQIKLNSISNLIITENWIIKTLPYTIYVAHQSDMELVADKVGHDFTIDVFSAFKQSQNIQKSSKIFRKAHKL